MLVCAVWNIIRSKLHGFLWSQFLVEMQNVVFLPCIFTVPLVRVVFL